MRVCAYACVRVYVRTRVLALVWSDGSLPSRPQWTALFDLLDIVLIVFECMCIFSLFYYFFLCACTCSFAREYLREYVCPFVRLFV